MSKNADAVLQLAAHLEVSLIGSHDTAVRLPGADPVALGPHGMVILQTFREPRSMQSALDHLASQTRSVTALAEMVSFISRLEKAGVLVSPSGGGTPRAAFGFASPMLQVSMLEDRVRTASFIDALRRTVTPDDVVVDLGTGTGVLAIAAAQAGARRVYAIEATAMADCAEAMFAASGVGDRITLVRGWSTEVELPERADVLVTETLGNGPWEEGFVHFVVDARRRLLRPGARVIPSRVRLFAQPVALPEDRRRRMQFTTEAAARWADWYGIDFSALEAWRAPNTVTATVPIADAAAWPAVCDPILLAELDAISDSQSPRSGEGSARCEQTVTVDGVLLAWEADVAPDVRVSTLPQAVAPVSSWRVTLLMPRTPCEVPRGGRLTVSIAFGPNPELELRSQS